MEIKDIAIGIMGVGLVASSTIGPIYWIVENDALNAVLSLFIPYWGAITVILDVV